MAAISRARRLFPDVVTELVPGAGHLPGLQMPDTVAPAIRSFLDRLTPGSLPAFASLSAPIRFSSGQPDEPTLDRNGAHGGGSDPRRAPNDSTVDAAGA